MSKYPNGYMPKIEYWTEQLVQAVKNEDIYEIDHVRGKLNYFIDKQHQIQVELDQEYENQAHNAFYSINN